MRDDIDHPPVAKRSAGKRAAWLIALALAAPTACRMPYIPPVTSPPPSAIADLADVNGRIVGRAVLVEQSGKLLGDAVADPYRGGPRAGVDVDADGRARVSGQGSSRIAKWMYAETSLSSAAASQVFARH